MSWDEHKHYGPFLVYKGKGCVPKAVSFPPRFLGSWRRVCRRLFVWTPLRIKF